MANTGLNTNHFLIESNVNNFFFKVYDCFELTLRRSKCLQFKNNYNHCLRKKEIVDTLFLRNYSTYHYGSQECCPAGKLKHFQLTI